jgi:hypothetical protein
MITRQALSIGKSNGLFHRRRAPILSPTLHHRELPPQSHQRLRGSQAGRPWGKASQTDASKCLCPTFFPIEVGHLLRPPQERRAALGLAVLYNKP